MAAIDLQTIKPAIHKWVSETSGVDVIWTYRGGIRPAGAYIHLMLHGPRQVGRAWIKRDAAPDPEPGRDIRVRALAHEMFRLELQCFADPNSGEDAESLLAEVTRGLVFHEDDLDAAGIGIGEMTDVQWLPPGKSGMLEPRAIANVWLHVGSVVESRIGSIERVQITAQALDPAGDVLLEETQWRHLDADFQPVESFSDGFSLGFEA